MMKSSDKQPPADTTPVRPALTRRAFLRRLGATAGAAVLVACDASPASEAPTAAPNAQPTAAPASAPAAASGAIKLVLMYSQEEFSDTELKAFTDANPNIQIERVPAGDDAQFKAMLAAGTPPDLFRTEGRFIPSLANQKVVLDLNEYFKSSDTFKPDNLAPANAYYNYQGTVYGMPKDWSPDHSLFVSNAAFQEAGLDIPRPDQALRYAEVAQLAGKLVKKDGDRIVRMGWGYESGWFVRTIQRIMAEQDQKLYTPDFSAMALKDSQVAVEALKFFYDASKENITWNPLNPSPAWSGDDFVKGLLGIVSYGYWYSGMLASAKDSPVTGKVTMLPAPTFYGKKRINPTVGAAGTAIAAGTKNPDAAWKLFEYYNSGEPAIARAKSGWGVPALKSLYPLMPKETEFQKQVQAVLQDELQYADYVLDVNPYYEDSVFNTSWVSSLDQALHGSITFDQLVENIEKACNAAIDEGRKA
ncbi:MAG: extracellular solute-binding protein [Roseiflexaceae bacterium]